MVGQSKSTTCGTWTVIAAAAAFVLQGGLAFAQDGDAIARAADTEVQAAESTGAPYPTPTLIEKSFKWVERNLSGSASDGFHPAIGGLIPGAGIAGGPAFRQHLFGNRAVFDSSAVFSWRRYSMLQSKVEWPALLNDRLSASAQVKYQDSTQINYFGIGSGTSQSAQTDYRLKTLDMSGSATVRPKSWLSIGVGGGVLSRVRVARGISSIYPATQDRFDEGSAPGLSDQPRLQHADAFVEADFLDTPGYPTSGGRYRIETSAFRDAAGTGHGFRLLEADVVQYAPLLHASWVVSVRGHVAVTQGESGGEIPFYLLPTLGGESTLRGYADYRFRDSAVSFVSAEYRWPIFRALDGSLFTDVGTTAPAARELWRHRAYRDYGVGFDVHSSTASLARIEIARGSEGVRLQATVTHGLHRSNRVVAPYVP